MIRKCLLVIGVLLSSYSIVDGKIFYVDARQGSDNYDGTAATYYRGNNGPWKTISKVNNMIFSPGDSILFKRGETWEGEPLVPANGGAPGGQITVNETILSQPIHIQLVNPNNNNNIYFGAYGSGAKPKINCGGGQGLVLRHNYITVENLHLDNGGNNMLAFARVGGNYWNIVSKVDITHCMGNAVRFQSGGGNCWLNGLNVYDYAVNGIYLEGSAVNPLKGVLVENCRVEDPVSYEKEDGISCHRDKDGNNIEGDIIIRNNTVIRSGEDGIDITSGTNILLAGNTLEYSNNAGIYVAKSRVNTVEVRGNFLNSNSLDKAVGDLTIACSKVRVVNNIISGTGHHCLFLEDASEVQLWNNVIAPSYRTGNFIWLTGNLSQVEFKNNIFDFTSTDQDMVGALELVQFDYNCYYTTSRSDAIHSDYSFDELKMANPAFEANGFWANPQFAGAQKVLPEDFMLSGTSPCIEYGTEVDLNEDYWNNLRPTGNAFDIGVFESKDVTLPCSGASNTEPCVANIKVEIGSDDVEESVSKGSVTMSSSDLELLFDSGNQLVGLRFNSIPIAPQSTVSNAYVQFTSDEINAGNTLVTIFGEDTDNAAPFSNEIKNVSSRPRTNAFVNWNVPAWYISGAAGVEQRTPNLSALIQEIVDRPGWENSNSITLIFTGSGKRVARSYEGSADEAPVLHIELGGTCPPAGTPCDDENYKTTNDVEDGNCNCAGTIPCPSAGTACDDGNPGTTDDVEDGNCNCAGTPCPLAGTACDDGNPGTIDDVEDGNCNCAGTELCPSAGTPCDDGDPGTIDDVEDGNCNCAGTPCPAAGTACDDGNPRTTSDEEDGNCNCRGMLCPSAGTPCNDGDPNTTNDVQDGNCNCAGTPPCPPEGTPCNDGNPNTPHDFEDGNCNCIGQDCLPAGTPCSDGDPNTLYDVEDGNCNCAGIVCPLYGTPCDDGNPNTPYDFEDGNCNCEGSQCPLAGTACDDRNPGTYNDVEDGNCNCAGTPCPLVGTACNDGNPNTVNDVEDGNCNCAGTPCPLAGTACDDGNPNTTNDVEDGNCNCAGSVCPPAGTACDDGDPNTINDAQDGQCNCEGVRDGEQSIYCDSRGGSTVFEWVETIIINGLRFPSGDNEGYKDHTNTLAVSQAGTLMPLELILGFTRNITVPYWRIWIDYNQNGTFESGNEMVFQFRNPNEVIRTQIQLPAHLNGRYNMRVSMKWGAYPAPCESFLWGEVEDFILLVSAAATESSQNSEAGKILSAPKNVSEKESTPSQYFSAVQNRLRGDLEIIYWNMPEEPVKLSLLDEQKRQVLAWNWEVKDSDGIRIIKQPANLKKGRYFLKWQSGKQIFHGALRIE